MADEVIYRQPSLGFGEARSGSTTIAVDRLVGTDSSWNIVYADAHSGSTTQVPALGWAFTASVIGAFGNTITLDRMDIIDNPSVTLKIQSGAFNGSKKFLYLSGSGNWSQNPPMNNGDLIQIVGKVISQFEFRPLICTPTMILSGAAVQAQVGTILYPWNNGSVY